MTVLLTVVVVVTVVGAGVGAMLFHDRREHRRSVQNGIRQ